MNEYIDKLRGRKSKAIGEVYKSAVAIPLYEENNELYVVFEKRSLNLRHQPGDICFPGGRLEEGEDPIDGALRETVEELNLDYNDIEFICELDYFITHSSKWIYSILVKLKRFPEKVNIDEVDHIFRIPLNYFLTNEPIATLMEVGPSFNKDFPFHLINGGKDYKFAKICIPQYFYKFGEYVIWGVTARILYEFINLIKD